MFRLRRLSWVVISVLALLAGVPSSPLAATTPPEMSPPPPPTPPVPGQPTLSIVVNEDPLAGWRVHLVTGEFLFAPQRISTVPQYGEGHAHIYVDGIKVARVYGPYHYLPLLGEGTHEIRVDLSGNDHETVTVNGQPVSATTTVDESQSAETAVAPVAGRWLSPVYPVPALEAEAIPDPAGGYTLRLRVENFRLAPDTVGRASEYGEGYAVLRIDDEEVGRLYGHWTQLPALQPGQHIIDVVLHANDYAPLLLGYGQIATLLVVHVPVVGDGEGETAHAGHAGGPMMDAAAG